MAIGPIRGFLVVITILCLAGPVLAEIHVVEMRNAKPGDPNTINVFTPPILKIAVGDSVHFVPVDKGHNSASKKGMLPQGADPWNSKIDEDVTITFTVEGTYGYICVPHYAMGMVGLILVGDHRGNLEEARKARQRGRAKKAFRQLFEQAAAD